MQRPEWAHSQAELEAARLGHRSTPPPGDPSAGAAAAARYAAHGRQGVSSGPGLGSAGTAARPRMSLDLARLHAPSAASPGQARLRREAEDTEVHACSHVSMAMLQAGHLHGPTVLCALQNAL